MLKVKLNIPTQCLTFDQPLWQTKAVEIIVTKSIKAMICRLVSHNDKLLALTQ